MGHNRPSLYIYIVSFWGKFHSILKMDVTDRGGKNVIKGSHHVPHRVWIQLYRAKPQMARVYSKNPVFVSLTRPAAPARKSVEAAWLSI